jgi:membrane protein YdbS with pleckstrin-like domain
VRHLATLGVAPPTDPHDRVQSGRFLRALLARWLVVSVAAWALVWLVADLPSWWLLIGGVTLAVLAADVLWLTYRVRRDESRVAER